MRSIWFACWVCSALFISSNVLGQGLTRIAVVSDMPALQVQAVAELQDLGYTPEVTPDGGGVLDAAACLTHMVDSRAAGLVEIRQDVDVAVWVYDPIARRAVRAEVVAFNPARDPSSVLLQALEALRGRLMQIEDVQAASSPPAQRHSEQSPKADLPKETVTRRRSTVRSGAGLSLLYGTGKLPPTWQVAASLQVRLFRRLSGVLHGFIPTIPMRLQNDAGQLRARHLMVGLGLRFDLRDPEFVVVPFATALVGPHVLFVNGSGAAGYLDNSDHAVAFAMVLRAGVDIKLSRRVVLFAAARLGLGYPRQVVGLGEEIPFGNPLVGGSIGLTLVLF